MWRLCSPLAIRGAVAQRAMATIRPVKEYEYVVLGGGNAAGYAAREFVQNDVPEDQVCIISEEAVPPYERPILTKGYLAKEKPSRLPSFLTCKGSERQDGHWYLRNGIRAMLRSRATSLNTSEQEIQLESGIYIKYSKLIVATGVGARRLAVPNDKGVHYMRSIADAERLMKSLQDAGPNARVAVIGGGYIGTEVAAGLVPHQLRISLVFPEASIFSGHFPGSVMTPYTKELERHGVVVMPGTRVVDVAYGQDGKVRGVVLDNGAIHEADVIVAGVGSAPDVSLFKGQLDIAEGGIKVNGKLQSSDPNVFAVGDIAAFPLPLEGGKITRQEFVGHARKSAAFVVRNLFTPDGQDYDYTPRFHSRMFNLSWKAFGVLEGEVVRFGTFEAGKKFGAVWVRDGQVVGVFFEGGAPEEYDALTEIVRERPTVEGNDDIAALLNGALNSDVEVIGEQ